METLIKAVQQFPCLWNVNHEKYRDTNEKVAAWHKIVEQNIPNIRDVKSARAEWKKLRDSHRDSLKRYKQSKPGQPLALNPWKHAQSMEYLVPFMKSRNGSNFEDFSSDYVFDPDQQSIEDNEEEEYAEADPLERVVGEPENIEVTRKRRHNSDVIDLIRELENNYSRRIEQIEDVKRQEKHPIELFFESMAQTAKKMPTFMQNRIKKQVLEVVCSAEEEFEAFNLTSNPAVSTLLVTSTSTQTPSASF